MTDYPPAHALIRRAALPDCAPVDHVVLGYDERFLRRKRLMTAAERGVMIDLPETTSAEAGDCFELMDGRLIAVVAAAEPVLVIRGDLPRLAWHIGNRHTPCQIEDDRLVIRDDHVLKAMLVQLGATVSHAMEPFSPEGGAYGHGRTMGHDHGPSQGAGHGHVPHVFTLSHPVSGLQVQHHASHRVDDDEPDLPDE